MKTGDFVIIALIIVISVILSISFLADGTAAENRAVRVTRENHDEIFDIDIDAIINVNDLTIVIKDSRVYVENAGCEDKICETMGEIENNGEFIVCIPSKVYIEIISEQDITHENADQIAG